MSDQRHTPYVPADSEMREFTLRALLIGLFMCVILGAANAYLGLRAGMTIAATYPAAVIGMAVLRLMKGSLLEENFARTVGSIGESVAAGAIFTIPAFVILNLWTFRTLTDYLTATALMILAVLLVQAELPSDAGVVWSLTRMVVSAAAGATVYVATVVALWLASGRPASAERRIVALLREWRGATGRRKR